MVAPVTSVTLLMEVFYVPLYYLWFRDEFGKRQKVTSHARTKSKALEILRNYNSLKAKTPEKILLSKFIQEVLSRNR